MSITGSLVGYENNNEVGSKKKRRSLLHNSSATSAHSAIMGKNGPPSLNSSISNSVITTASSSLGQQQYHHQQQQQQLQQKYMNSKRKHAKYNNMHPAHHMVDHNNYLHLNSLWSIWYGVLLTLFQGYLAVHGAYRFLGCSLIPWKIEPVAELNLQIVLSGVVFILLPLFFTSAVFKVGNLANDGIKLATGSKERRCSMTPHDGLEEEARGGTLRALWTHGGPTAAFVHIVIAMCLLLPRLLLEARIIENGLLPRENIWQTELDFIAVNRRNLVVLSVVTSPYQNISNVEDEDYYNDTMFTAVGSSSSISIGNINNNLLDANSKTDKPEKQAGKTSFFEVPDLINGESTEDENYRENENANANGRRFSAEIATDQIIAEMEYNLFLDKFLKPQTTTTSTTTTNRVFNKNYDRTWDKFGTLGKGNSLSGEPTTIMTTTTTVGGKMTSTAAATTTKTTVLSTTTTSTTEATTTTAVSTSSSSTSTSTIGSGISSTYTTSQVSIPSNKTHSHHNHSKSSRKHSNRQHRPRTQNHRRHHATTTTTSTGRSDEIHSARSNENERSTEIRPSKVLDLNRLNDLEVSTVFEQSTAPVVLRKTSTNRDPSASYEDLDYGRRAAYPKSTSTISTTTRDSNIHIVKPEKLPEIIPSTPVSSNSKIIEIKTKAKKVKRMADDELQVEIEPEYLIGDLPNNDSSEYIATTPASSSESSTLENIDTSKSSDVQPGGGIVRLDGFAGMLQIFFGIEKHIDVSVFDHPPSAEFVNLVFALLVWCVRYPAVFWSTTKSFATIFSIQMIAAAMDIIFSYVGVSNLYKLQVYSEAIPVQTPGIILNGVVTLALFLLSSVLLIASSMIMYLYGHGRLAAKMRDRSLITMKSSETWIYFAHCASLCFVLALAVVKAPLLNDLSATYRNNLHCPTFLSALISVVHLLLWIVIWLGLTAKRRWTFKLPPVDTYGIGKATTQPLLMPNRGSIPNSIGGSGGLGACIDQKGVGTSTNSSTDGGGGGVEDIYWPKLTPSSPKLKVTFNEVTSTSDDVLLIGDHEQTDGKRHSPRGTTVCFTSAAGEIDDGEYATLRTATAATVVGIGIGGRCVSSMGGGVGNGNGGDASNTPTGNVSIIGSVKILHLSEYDELPPPPPQLMSSSNHTGIPCMEILSGAVAAYVGDYANCGGIGDDNTSEEGKLLACVRDDSVTYASTRDLEPPQPPPPPPPPPPMLPEEYSSFACGGRAPQAIPEIMQLSSKSSSPEHLVSPLAPVTVTVHTNEAHIASSSTPRCLRRADSGVPNEALTPRSDTTSTTESTTSPPERAPSESSGSSGVHSGEERDVEVVIRPRVACKPPPRPPQPAIQEEPYGRCTNMRMSSFIVDRGSANSSTLPLTRTAPEQKFDYSHCSTMPLPASYHNQQQHIVGEGGYSTSSANSMHPQHHPHVSTFKTQVYANSAVAMAGANAAKQQQQLQLQMQQQQLQAMHTTLPNGVRYSNPHFLRRMPHVTKAAESPYGHLGLGAGHHTFSKLLHDPLQGSLANTAIPEDRDSANYSMSSDQDCNLYATANHLN